jgi:two-component system chemotaxis response regulator CheY
MRKQVMVVDDSRTVRQIVGAVLVKAGYEVVEAVDGVDGASQVEQRPELAMVICDINMPRMNGLEMLEAVKSEGKNATLPVIMLTTEGKPQLIARAKEAGAKGWIVKPFKPEMLLATVKKLVGEASA